MAEALPDSSSEPPMQEITQLRRKRGKKMIPQKKRRSSMLESVVISVLSSGVPPLVLPEESGSSSGSSRRGSLRETEEDTIEQVSRVVVEGDTTGTQNYEEDGGRRGYDPETYSHLYYAVKDEERRESLRRESESLDDGDRQRLQEIMCKMFGPGGFPSTVMAGKEEEARVLPTLTLTKASTDGGSNGEEGSMSSTELQRKAELMRIEREKEQECLKGADSDS